MASQDLPPWVVIDTPVFNRGGVNSYYGLASFYPRVTIVWGKNWLLHRSFPGNDGDINCSREEHKLQVTNTVKTHCEWAWYRRFRF